MKNKKYINLDDVNEQHEFNNKKKKVIKKNVFERFSTKENILIFSFVLILLIIGVNLLKRFDPFKEIEYNEITVEDIINGSIIEYDRDIYWTLNEILLQFLSSNDSGNSPLGEGKVHNTYYKYEMKEYYNILTEDYKNYLGKVKYLKTANDVIKKYKNNYENLNVASNKVPIRKIYKYQKIEGDYFLIQLNTSIETYVGIKLNKELSTYSIFYLE